MPCITYKRFKRIRRGDFSTNMTNAHKREICNSLLQHSDLAHQVLDQQINQYKTRISN